MIKQQSNLEIIYQPHEPFVGLTSRFLTGNVLDEDQQILVEFFRQYLLKAEEVHLKNGTFVPANDNILTGFFNSRPMWNTNLDDW